MGTVQRYGLTSKGSIGMSLVLENIVRVLCDIRKQTAVAIKKVLTTPFDDVFFLIICQNDNIRPDIRSNSFIQFFFDLRNDLHIMRSSYMK